MCVFGYAYTCWLDQCGHIIHISILTINHSPTPPQCAQSPKENFFKHIYIYLFIYLFAVGLGVSVKISMYRYVNVRMWVQKFLHPYTFNHIYSIWPSLINYPTLALSCTLFEQMQNIAWIDVHYYTHYTTLIWSPQRTTLLYIYI